MVGMKKTQCSIDRTLSNLLHKSHCKSNIQYYIYSKVGFTKNKKEVYKVSMFINEIKELKLIFPISVEIGVSHIATAKIGSNEFYGEGKTVEEAIENLKTAIYDMHHSLCSDDNVMYTKQGKATKEKFLSSFK